MSNFPRRRQGPDKSGGRHERESGLGKHQEAPQLVSLRSGPAQLLRNLWRAAMTLGCCRLRELAQVALGYKSLQNRFFYLGKADLSTYQIEQRFTIPVYRMKDLDPGHFLQQAKPSGHLFFCNLDEVDLRGTRALR